MKRRQKRPIEGPHGLSPRQAAFAANYLRLGKANEAAWEAGYSRGSTNIGYKVLNLPHVAYYVRSQIQAQYAREHGSNEELIALAWRLARFDPRCLVKEDGSYKSLQELTQAEASGIRSMEVELKFDEDGAPPTAIKKIKMVDQLHALTLLAKIAKLLQPDTQVTNVFIGLDARMDRAQQRVEAARKRIQEKVVSEQ